MAFQNKFNFTGDLLLPKENSKRPFCRELEIKKKTGKSKAMAMTFGIKESDTNAAFVEAFDSVQDTIMTMDQDNEKIEVAWDERFDPEVIKIVANYKKYTVNLGEEYGGNKEFITQYDMIEHLKEFLPKYKGKLTVTGQLVKEAYKGEFYDKFKLTNVYEADEEAKNRLSITLDIFYNKDSIDKSDYKTDQKLYLNAYISQYVNKEEGSKFFPQMVVLNTSKYDPNNEKHQKLLQYKLSYLEIKNKTIVHIPWELVLIKGAETVEFNESMLTKAQMIQVELGIKKVEDFKPRSGIAGDKINEYRLYDPILKDFGNSGNFSDGLVDTGMKISEFEAQCFVPDVGEEKMDDVMKELNGKVPAETDIDVSEEDLF